MVQQLLENNFILDVCMSHIDRFFSNLDYSIMPKREKILERCFLFKFLRKRHIPVLSSLKLHGGLKCDA